MPSLPISTVRQKLFGLVQQVNDDHDPLTVVTKTGENAVLVAESDWNSLMETLYVLQTHGGEQLLRSAQDAREGRTQTHALIDPDTEESKPPAVAPAEAGELLWAIAEKFYAAGVEGTAVAEAKKQVGKELREKGFDVAIVREDRGRRPSSSKATPPLRKA
ncbi:type II toxin-antitoxin system Phd/YefM family antitoxin [Nocardia pseudobrasiliensis]|uniref:Antitoxin n=1 Tax=Nocardia pseudobrasiliensis TaxID=45979 RepID=A0A370I1Q8_9NOCA|nr:type II toxin-antitoxin system Phd/YefM family antitoxin [Nocardia pseudobrasiliensis]RDI64682.1 prevent-host-death family protein [Nocardia pseudobrasiliensis]